MVALPALGAINSLGLFRELPAGRRILGAFLVSGAYLTASALGVAGFKELIAGTTDWKRIEQIVRVPDDTRLLAVQVVRPRSLKFDSLIGGTAWIDDVSLARIE